MVEGWNRGGQVVVEFDQHPLALAQLPRMERTYGPRFRIGQTTYPGFWKDGVDTTSKDSHVVALAKANNWVVVAEDASIRGACLLEGVECIGWEELARRAGIVP